MMGLLKKILQPLKRLVAARSAARTIILAFLIFVVFLGQPGSTFSQPKDERQVQLVVGYTRTIKTEYMVGDIAVGKAEICDFVVGPSRQEIILNPQSQGTTVLTLWDTSGVKQEAIKLIVTLDDDQVRALADQITEAIGSSQITAKAIRGNIVLEGIVYSDWEKERAEKLASVFTGPVMNLIEVRKADRDPRAEKTIQVVVHFVEISNLAISGFSIQWGSQGATELTLSKPINQNLPLTGVITGTLSNFLPVLSYAVERGAARVLEQASLIAKSGGSGEVFGGGEVGVPVSQGYGAIGLEFKEIGVGVKVKPVLISDGVDLVADIEVSALSGINANGVLTIQKSRVNCHEFIMPGQSVAMGGLISNRISTTKNRLPFDSENFLFRLYASKDFQQRRSQFVIFLTPKVLDGPPDSTEELRQWQQRIESQDKKNGKQY